MDKIESTELTERELPLVSALETVRNRHSFHMPGNRAGRSFSAEFRTLLTYLDTTELENTGDINDPAGVMLRALELAAKTFGSAQTYFITSGSSISLRIAMAGAFKPGDRVLVAKGSHLSVTNSCALLDLEAVLIKQDVLPRFADGQPSEAEVLRSLKEEENLSGVLLTTPGYYGENLPLERICRTAHDLGIPVIVDSAHGAHFAIKVRGESFGEKNWPRTALSQGADIVAQSAHKTLPALTPASMLHLSQAAINSGRVSSARLARMLPVFQTSSPSFPIAASLDYARDFIDHDAAGYVSKLLDLLDEFVAKLPPELSREYIAGDDPCRLVIDYSASNCSRQNVFKILDAHEVDVELIDARCMVCIPSLDTPRESFIALGQACREIARAGQADHSQVKIDLAQREAFLRQSRTSLTLRESFSTESEEIDFRLALGQRSAGIIAPYPPGVPLLWPGEEITSADIDLWQKMLDLSYDVRGIKSGKVEVFAGK